MTACGACRTKTAKNSTEGSGHGRSTEASGISGTLAAAFALSVPRSAPRCCVHRPRYRWPPLRCSPVRARRSRRRWSARCKPVDPSKATSTARLPSSISTSSRTANATTFFDFVEVSLIAATPKVAATLAGLRRHDRIRIHGALADNRSQQPHVEVSSLEVVSRYEASRSIPAYEHSARFRTTWSARVASYSWCTRSTRTARFSSSSAATWCCPCSCAAEAHARARAKRRGAAAPTRSVHDPTGPSTSSWPTSRGPSRCGFDHRPAWPGSGSRGSPRPVSAEPASALQRVCRARAAGRRAQRQFTLVNFDRRPNSRPSRQAAGAHGIAQAPAAGGQRPQQADQHSSVASG